MLGTRHEAGGLIADRFKPIRALRQNLLHARDGRRHVAIELVPASEHDLGEMRRAIAIANAIDHPNLCRPREVLEHADQLVIVTELVDGVSIGDRLVIGPFDPLHVGALMVELLSVLSKIHAEGLAHGGISPNTVMIDAAGLLRLIDLGVVRGPQRPTARLDIEAVGALAATMLAGYLGSVPGPLLAWIARCSDQVRPFPDAAAAAAGLVTPDVRSTKAPPSGVGKQIVVPPERVESSVATKIPSLDELTAKPLEVVPAEAELRGARTPSAMVKTEKAEIAIAKPAVTRTPASRFPWLVGGLAAAVATVAIFVWWTSQRAPGAPRKPAVAVAPPIEPPPTPRPRPPLPTGAVMVPDKPVPIDPPLLAKPVFAAVMPATTPAPALEVVFSPEAVWIETPGVYVLEEAYRQLIKHPLARVEVTGYSSSDGQEARNTQLAIGRALSVKKYLVERGVDGARIAIVAKPTTPGVGGDANSRRAEVRIVLP